LQGVFPQRGAFALKGQYVIAQGIALGTGIATIIELFPPTPVGGNKRGVIISFPPIPRENQIGATIYDGCTALSCMTFCSELATE